MTSTAKARVSANDWAVLSPPAVGRFEPSVSVSVVVPAFRAGATLPHTLAALAVQSYPSELLEVVVVDDSGDAVLPELRPARTRLVRVADGWGRANACAVGADASDGTVVHWLDADMVPFRDHVEAQLRWHHVSDYAVVLGNKLFVDPDLRSLDPGQVRDAVGDGRVEELFAGLPAARHEWVESIWEQTDDLRTAGWTAYRVHVGATASVRRDLYRAAGGMDRRLRLGEDIDLGYRLAQAGAVFVPERGARSWHLGPTNVMRRREEINRYNAPWLTDRISQLRWRRTGPGRTYSVPYVHVAVDARGRTYEEVVASVESLLASSLSDLRVQVVAAWQSMQDERCHVIDDPQRDLRMVQAAFTGDARVDLVEEPPSDVFPSAFLVHLPAGWRLGENTLETVLREMERDNIGLRQILLADGEVVRVVRTAALRRARLVAEEGEDLDDVLDEVYGSWWSSGEDDGFRHHLEG